MRKPTPLTFAHVPAWAMPAKPDALALYEVIALAGLENKWVRLSAAQQREIMGAVVFGKQEFMIGSDGVLTVSRSACFGIDSEQAEYTVRHVMQAIMQCVRLSPGLTGRGYLSCGMA